MFDEMKTRYRIEALIRQTAQIGKRVCFDHVQTILLALLNEHPVVIYAAGCHVFLLQNLKPLAAPAANVKNVFNHFRFPEDWKIDLQSILNLFAVTAKLILKGCVQGI